MTIPTTSLIDRLRSFAARRFPSLFARVTRSDVRRAQEHLDALTDKEVADGRDAARKAIEAARNRDPESR
jgi:hypothetical protein